MKLRPAGPARARARDGLGHGSTRQPPLPGRDAGAAQARDNRGDCYGKARNWRPPPERAYERLCVPEWRAFCHAVWHAEVPGPCKLITRHLSSTGADEARWYAGMLPYCATALVGAYTPGYRSRRRGSDAALGAPRDSSPVGRRRHPRRAPPPVHPEVRGAGEQVDLAASGHRLVHRVDWRFAMGRRARGVAPCAAACGRSS